MQRKMVLLAFAVAFAGFFSQMVLQRDMKPYALKGLYFQKWSSEFFMQTVSIEDLRDVPLQSLANLHIQPPALDTIRAVLAKMWASPDSHALLRDVDRSLYVLWAAVYGFLIALVFWWLSRITGSGYAVLSALFFAAHPAAIFYSTLLDGTLLSALLMMWATYLLWCIRKDPAVSIAPLAVAVLALFFTRSIFQWPAILVFALSLILLRVPKRRVAIFFVVCTGVAGLYLGKQYHRFGLFSTSSFTGLSLVHSIGYEVDYWNFLDRVPDTEEKRSLPRVLVRRKKLDGAPNFNHVGYLRMNRHLLERYKTEFAATPARELIRSYRENLGFYFLPSSRYTEHVIVDRIPWRDFYDRIFSFPVLPALLLLAGIVWFAGAGPRDCAAGIALALPGLYVFLISVLCDKGENMRFKFFMEPVFFVFIAAELHAAGERIYRKVCAKETT